MMLIIFLLYINFYLLFSSKMEVVNFLTKRGLIDKKSDDEDAKYVKPVLRLSFK